MTWTHFCKEAGSIRNVLKGDICFRCQRSEDEVPNYPGKHWIYPAKLLVSWPECQQYYYYLDKKSS